eukprot:SAG31_NODE_93_length_26250_cov_47.615082_4_plen_86_part_00
MSWPILHDGLTADDSSWQQQQQQQQQQPTRAGPLGAIRVAHHPGRAHVRWTALLLILVWFPLGAICVCSAPLLRAVGQPADVSDL